MAEGLKVMAMEGHGVAFLPYSAVKKDLRGGKLVRAAPPELKQLEITMEVRAYREKPSPKHAPKGTAQALWAFLASEAGAASVLTE
jgi:DNA-binding transcriptional LysR family regulator